MKKINIILIVLSCLILSACSTIAKVDYMGKITDGEDVYFVYHAELKDAVVITKGDEYILEFDKNYYSEIKEIWETEDNEFYKEHNSNRITFEKINISYPLLKEKIE